MPCKNVIGRKGEGLLDPWILLGDTLAKVNLPVNVSPRGVEGGSNPAETRRPRLLGLQGRVAALSVFVPLTFIVKGMRTDHERVSGGLNQ